VSDVHLRFKDLDVVSFEYILYLLLSAWCSFIFANTEKK
jgi:hypothetical protein